MDVQILGQDAIVDGLGDVAREREHRRQYRLLRVLVLLGVVAAWLGQRILVGSPFRLGWPRLSIPPGLADYLPGLILVGALGMIIVIPLAVAGRSPHVLYRPGDIDIGFSDVVGLGIVRTEAVNTLNLFLAHKTFRDSMGGNPRRAILFEGPPGTGKTYMAKAMAHEAGVPFLFVSASAFQSMYYGQTNRKIRAFFTSMRKIARREGGAIGFIEEIDAIAGRRGGMRASPVGGEGGLAEAGGGAVTRADMREGISGVVNELLVQLQSFDEPTRSQRAWGGVIELANRFLPASRRIPKATPRSSNTLVIAATNRAADLDPALVRPGRFDRTIHFDLPSRSGRREIIDYYLAKKSHLAELDRDDRRDQLAALTVRYTPVMIEHLFDEALVWALRGGRDAMTWDDLQQAKFTEEIGLKQPVEYTAAEKATIATHEAGHAVVAYVKGIGRRLEVLSIIKRADALGLLAHSETEERFTQTRSELLASIQISFGGIVAEELFFGESGTGPGSDLASATGVAARMVGSFGMAGSLVSFDAIESSPVTGGIVARVLADKEGRRAVNQILNQARADVGVLLDERRPLVVALRDALLDREELVGDEITDVLVAAMADAEVDGKPGDS